MWILFFFVWVFIIFIPFAWVVKDVLAYLVHIRLIADDVLIIIALPLEMVKAVLSAPTGDG